VQWVQFLRDWAAIAQSIVTILAIIAGAAWFMRRRQRFPRANVTQTFTHWYAKDVLVVHAAIKVANVGNVVLRLRECSLRIMHLLPATDDVIFAMRTSTNTNPVGEVEWPIVAKQQLNWKGREREIEPGETDEILIDLTISGCYEIVLISTYMRNLSKSKDIGWIATTIYDVSPAAALGNSR
jgi:hypothetical protein